MAVPKQAKPDHTTKVMDQLLALAPEAMVIMGPGGRILRVNSSAEELLGYSQGELLGQTPDSLIPSPKRKSSTTHWGRASSRTKVRPLGHGLEAVVRRGDSTELPIEINLGLLNVGANTLISSDIRKIQREASDELDLRALVDASDDAIIGKTLDGTVISWNKGAEKMYGYKAEEILGKPISVLMSPGHPNELPEIMKRLRRGEHFQRFETTRIHKDGHPIDVSLTISPVKSKGGVVVGASVVARDITEHKETQSALLDLRALVDASDDAIIGTDLDGTILSWNKGAEKICGYTAEEILGRSVSVFVPPDRLHEHYENLMRLRRGEHIQRFETTRIRKDGHPFDVSITISPVMGRGGVVVGASVVARDITEQRQASDALRLSEERFRVALKNAPVVVFSQDLKLRYTWVNSPRLFPPEEYIGRTDVEIFGREDGARIAAIKEEVLRTGNEAHAEVTITLKGRKHYFDLLVEPLRDPGGKILGLLCSAIDTTFLKQTILRLQNALNEVQLLKGLLPICANCKKIKDERERWQPLEGYIQDRSEAKFTHGLCPDCLRELYPEYYP